MSVDQDHALKRAPPSKRQSAKAEASDSKALSPVATEHKSVVSSAALENALGQTLKAALDFDNWREGADFQSGFAQAQDYIVKSVQQDKAFRKKVQQHVLSKLDELPDAPDDAGVYSIKSQHLRSARRNHLLTGNVTATKGASTWHESLAATLVSVGVCLTRYDGELRSWRTVFLRHDCDIRSEDPIEEIKAVLNQRARRSKTGPGADGRDRITDMMRRAFVEAAERKSLLEKTDAAWRMGHGVPTPWPLLTGSGSMELVEAVLPVFEALLLKNKRWVFIPERQDNFALTTLASALDPGQLAIIQKGKATIDAIVEGGHYEAGYKSMVREFAKKAGEAFVVGAFRATQYAPAQLFFAHAENALQAGVIAMADAELQPHRGSPLLLELARISAKVGLGMEAFRGMVESAYARAGAADLFSPESVYL